VNFLNQFEKLVDEAYSHSVLVKEKPLNSNSNGLYVDNRIALNTNRLNTTAEKACTLAEELSHHHYNCGDILDDSDINNRKQEYRARFYTYNKLIGLKGLVDARQARCQNLFEIAEYLNVTPEFLNDALECYKSKYGLYAEVDNYAIIFYEGDYTDTDKEWYGYKILENKSF